MEITVMQNSDDLTFNMKCVVYCWCRIVRTLCHESVSQFAWEESVGGKV